jgi:hypothetical protein
VKNRLLPLLLLVSLIAAARPAAAEARWSPEKANSWYGRTGWLVGCNFSPSTAINQLEMWQAETFDPNTIDRELGWAESLGFNSVRVFLHNLLWEQDSAGFVKRMNRFLEMADRHHIGVVFVLFDSVWNPNPHLGRQQAPTPHLHNSGWVQSPGAEILRDPSRYESLKPYVMGVLKRFSKDRRIHAWDLINEPDNDNHNSYRAWEPPNKAELGFALLKKVWAWAKEANPEQPLTAAPWKGEWSPDKLTPLDRFMFEESDVITFHNYGTVEDISHRAEQLKRYGRPVICTEYMARPMKSTFQNVLPTLKQMNVGAYNWGFVAGKTNTIYPWDSWQQRYTAEPPVWFHDIFRADGTPYIPAEVDLIRRLTGKTRSMASLRFYQRQSAATASASSRP